MAKLIKTKTEWEGTVHEEYSIIEGNPSPIWPSEKKFKVIGKDQTRIDGTERVTGRATYTYDVQLPGMLYAKILRSPHPHARIKKMDIKRALSLSGVRSILTYQNVPRISWWNDTIILEDTVRFAGDEIAAIAADDIDIAEDALRLIDVKYEILPFVLTIEDALRPGAPKVYPQGNLVGGKAREYQRGAIKRGFEEADVIVEETFKTQSVLHNCLESHGVVARWEGEVLTVWESTQSIYKVQEELMEAFNLPQNKVRVICEYMGSGFGSKQYSGKWSILAALLARQTGRPVHLMYDRYEENLAAGNRAPTLQHLKVGARRDGTITAIDLDGSISIGAYGWSVLSVEGPAQIMYACPNVHTIIRSVFTHTGPARSFRGPGYVEGNFPLESTIDEMAKKLNIDPIAMRLKNHADQEQTSGRRYSANHLKECYQKGSELIGWSSNPPVSKNNSHKKRGLGMASQTWGGGGGPPAYAWVRINNDATIEVIIGSQDIGTGTRTVLAQIAAEELGCNIDNIVVRLGDTAGGPYDPVSWGSMTISSVGPAVRQAAIDARNQLTEITADFLGISPNEMEIKEGNILIKGKRRSPIKLIDVLGETGEFTILGKGSREPNQTDSEVRTFGAQFADVEVDVLTGEVNVLKMVTVHDVGRVMNPLGAGNQAEGALIQGIGYGLSEERIVDQNTGIVLNANMEEYLLPTALDFNDISCAFIDKPDNLANTLGAKGLGEPALIPTAPAIANAIARATGIRFLSLPITRDKILTAVEKFGDTGGSLP